MCHLSPGTSKWNKIEHRPFSAISMNWRGRPLTSHQVVVDLIANTTVGVEGIEDPVDRDELARQAMASLDELPQRERYAFVERIMNCRPAKDVAAELGIKPQQVSQLYNAALGRFRKLPAFTALLQIDRPLPGPFMATGPDETGTPS